MRQLANTIRIITGTLLLVSSFASYAAPADDANATKAQELETLRTRIKDVETRIKSAQDESEKLQKELRTNELTTAETLTQLHDIQLGISNRNAELEELMFEQAEHEAALKQEKEKLTHQIRSAYQIGRNDYIKLILNQEDPALVGRALAYYDYHNRARSERIVHVKSRLESIDQIQSSIKTETAKLESLKSEQEAKLSDFHQYRASRRDIVTRLQHYIAAQGVELNTLQENERELGVLFQG